MAARQRLESWWRRTVAEEKPGPLGVLAQGALLTGTLPFEAVTWLRDRFYRWNILPTLRLPVPVVSFGNLTAGGTGKTPAVIWCAEYLIGKGLKVGIASRGYNPDASGETGPNDEAQLIEERLADVSHVWNADRAQAGKALVKEHHCNVVILDDGFQHRRLHRTLDFLLIDALNPFGFGYMLPRGLLREPLGAISRATGVIITRSNLVSRDELVRIRKRIWQTDENIKVAEAMHRPVGLFQAGGEREEVESLKGRKAFVFCGVGNPHSLVIMLLEPRGRDNGHQVIFRSPRVHRGGNRRRI